MAASKYTTRKNTPAAKASTMARKAARAVKYSVAR